MIDLKSRYNFPDWGSSSGAPHEEGKKAPVPQIRQTPETTERDITVSKPLNVKRRRTRPAPEV